MENIVDGIDAEELKAEINKIRGDHKRAKGILLDIEGFLARFKEAVQLLNDPNNGLDANLDASKRKRQEINDLYSQSEETARKISVNIEKARVSANEMQVAYNEFNEIKGEISGKKWEISQLAELAKNLKNDIEKSRDNAESSLKELNVLLSDARQKMQNMQGAYESFLEIKGKIEDGNTGLQAILNNAQDLQKKSQALFQEIQSYRDDSNKLFWQIKDHEQESNKLKERTKKVFEESKATADKEIEEIKKITALIAETGFSNAFQEQQKSLTIATYIWLWVLVISIGALAYFLFLLFVQHDENGVVSILQKGPTEILYRFSLTSPLLFIISFAVAQYSRNKNLSDRYAFKAATSGTIKHHITFLQKSFPKDEKEVIAFATDTLTKIYKEPYDHKADSKKIKELETKIDGLKSAEREKLDIESVLKSAKELKGLFNDDTLLKQVMEFLSRFLSK